MKKAIAIIGCGVIGSTLAGEADKNLSDHIKRVLLWDIDADKTVLLFEKLSNVAAAGSMEEAIEEADLIVEAATPRVAEDLIKVAVDKGKDIMIMSIGGMLGQEKLLAEAREKGIRVILPSGAICGIDGVKAAKVAGIKNITMRILGLHYMILQKIILQERRIHHTIPHHTTPK